ncbi:MAG TPA: hypothetical protein VGE41_06385 [Verrucomicrobiae bacterium]|jgi:uncharacterized membrane protein YidH (DUF202 family)
MSGLFGIFGKLAEKPATSDKPAVVASESHTRNLNALVLTEAQLLLAEKRTSFSSLRTGIAIFALPLSVLSVLIATSRNYDIFRVMPLLVPLIIINLGLIALAVYLICHSFRRIHHYDRLMADLKREHKNLAGFLD